MADDDFQCCASGTHEWKGTPMSEQAQVGDTVRLTVTAQGKVAKTSGGGLEAGGYFLHAANTTVEILSRATQPLPSEPGTWWLDRDGDLWRVSLSGTLIHPVWTRPETCAPFRQLVLK